MSDDYSRRGFLATALAAGTVGLAAAEDPAPAPAGAGGPIHVLAICGSPRKPSTTAASLEVCLEAARAVDPRIETELLELAGLELQGDVAAGVELPPGARDDFPSLLPKLTDPSLAAVIIGTPVYFGNMTSRCKAFLDRCMALRKDFLWSNKVAGIVAVGGARNGGQELAIASVQNVLLCHEMLLVGEGRPTAHRGATVWNDANHGGATADEIGMGNCRALGRRVAELVLARRG